MASDTLGMDNNNNNRNKQVVPTSLEGDVPQYGQEDGLYSVIGEREAKLVTAKGNLSTADKALDGPIMTMDSTSKMDDLDLQQHTGKRLFPKFELGALVSSNLYCILNDAGEVVHRSENTPAALLLGANRTRMLFQFAFGTMARFCIFMGYAPVGLAIHVLGIAMIIPKWAFLFNISISLMWFLFGYGLLIDWKIYRNLCLSFSNIIALLASILMGIFFGFLCNWDYRGCCMIVIFPLQTGLQVGLDAVHSRIRKTAALSTEAVMLAFLATILVMCYTQRFPELNY